MINSNICNKDCDFDMLATYYFMTIEHLSHTVHSYAKMFFLELKQPLHVPNFQMFIKTGVIPLCHWCEV